MNTVQQARLPVRAREILSADGSRAASATVFCPKRERSVETRVCEACPHFDRASTDAILCSPPCVVRPGVALVAASAASRATIWVRANVTGSTIFSMASGAPWGFPVVDERDRFMGFVSPSSIAFHRLPERFLATTRAGELAFGTSLAVLEVESLPSAIRAMARKGARALALVDDARKLLGLLSDVDALSALATGR